MSSFRNFLLFILYYVSALKAIWAQIGAAVKKHKAAVEGRGT